MRLCKVDPLVLRESTEVYGVAFSLDGEHIASAGNDGKVKIWDSRTRRIIQEAYDPPEALARYFEFWLLRLEGVYPALDRCPRCGRTVLAGGAVLVTADRAYVCEACAHGGSKLSADAIAFLRRATARTPLEVANGESTPRALRWPANSRSTRTRRTFRIVPRWR